MRPDDNPESENYVDDSRFEFSPCINSPPISEIRTEEPNNTKIKKYRRSIRCDVIIVGNEPIISLIIARSLSDSGIKVIIINKPEESVGFEEIFSLPTFINFLLKKLNIESCSFIDKKSLVKTLISHAKNKELIYYYGEKFRIRDFGYDGNKNYFLADISRRKNTTELDELIYSCLGRRAYKLEAFLPRALKIKQIIGNKMIVNHWLTLLKGWGAEKDGSLLNFTTNRPNTVMMFGGDRIAMELDNEKDAQDILNEEIEKFLSEINALKWRE